MIIKTDKPRLPIDRLKHPVRQMRPLPETGEILRLNGKTGDELDETVKRLYEARIEKG